MADAVSAKLHMAFRIDITLPKSSRERESSEGVQQQTTQTANAKDGTAYTPNIIFEYNKISFSTSRYTTETHRMYGGSNSHNTFTNSVLLIVIYGSWENENKFWCPATVRR